MAKKKEAFTLFKVVAENLSSNELGLKTKKANTEKENHSCNCEKCSSKSLVHEKDKKSPEVLSLAVNQLKMEVLDLEDNIKRKDFYSSFVEYQKRITDRTNLIYELLRKENAKY